MKNTGENCFEALDEIDEANILQKEEMDYFVAPNKEKLITFSPIALKCITRKTSAQNREKFSKIGSEYNMCFKLIKCDRKLVRTVLFSYGFLQCSNRNPNVNLIWTNTHLQQHVMRALKPWQRINHFPRSHCITKKDSLYINIARAKAMFNLPFNFIPDFFITPEDIERVREALKRIESNPQHSPLIVKPAGSSSGRGIIIMNMAEKAKDIDLNTKMLVSSYIANPLLLNGLKFDLRIYVCVTSFYPLIVYIYREGLTRFATQKYDISAENLDEAHKHLTNYSLNKISEKFVKNMDPTEENVGHKWSLSALLRELEQRNIDTKLLMVRIEDIVIKTLLSAQHKIVPVCRSAMLNPRCCFELFGFDILIDDQLKPWLLEVNLSPSLGCDAPLDSILKTRLLCDVLNIASIPLVRENNILNTCAPTIEQESQPTDNGKENADIPSSFPIEALSTTYVNGNSDALSSTSSGYASGGGASSSSSDRFTSSGRINSARKNRLNSRVTKVKKATIFARPSFFYERQNSQYKSRIKFYANKMNTEIERKGAFIRIFPRTTTWSLYSGLMEDIGPEEWDKAIYEELYGSTPYYSARDIENAHEQLINASQYPSQENLSNIVREIFSEALSEADKYREKMPPITVKPFPVALPRVRSPARRRTQSCMESDELRRIRIEEERKAQEIHTVINPSADQNYSNCGLLGKKEDILSQTNLNEIVNF
uniref:Tubulin--tyrosine ligase-like protein 5 n=1 Tax=Acrobeloides nanus TaxID=290746 RepID=A0A914C078_9BILA